MSQVSNIYDVRTTNVRDTSFTVSWLTDVAGSGEVRYGTDPNHLNQTAYDKRGGATSDDTHYVIVNGLQPETTYYFDVVSGSVTDDNHGMHYQITTGPIVNLPSPDTVYGDVWQSDGSTPASGTIIYITLSDADGMGTTGQAAPLSALVDSNGDWSTNLGNARTTDLSGLYLYSASGDSLRLEAVGAADGSACDIVDTGHDSPASDIVLDLSNCTTTWPINLETGWNHISLPLEPLTPLMAGDVCNNINSQGGNISEIDRWHNGGWEGHVCGEPFNNFELVLGSDYFR